MAETSERMRFVGTCVKALLMCAVASSVACSKPPAEITAPVAFKVETVASNLEVPWSIVFAPGGRILFTERPGRLREIVGGKLVEKPIHTFKVSIAAETGLMGLCLHPDFAKNKLLYVSFADSRSSVRVVRYKETADGLSEEKVIIADLPAAQFHAGCRIKFGPDKKLYITTGDATTRDIAQDLNSLGGKVLRLNDDGSIPADNPFVAREGARHEIWSYGHRNPQGIDWMANGAMVETEHGPSGFDGPGGGDEVNIIEKGKNYGWPVVHHKASHEGMVSPLIEFTPAVAPGSVLAYKGSKFPEWKGSIFFGGLVGEGLYRVVLDGRRVVSHEKVISDMGRIRALAEAPDGTIYFSTSNRDGRGRPAADDDRIMRIVPQS
jgi:glucose/arabinose dehydrogenase